MHKVSEPLQPFYLKTWDMRCRPRCLGVYEEEEERCQGGTTLEDGDAFLDQSCSRGPETALLNCAR